MIKVTPELIEGFVGSILSKRFDEATAIPYFHKELWGYACSEDRLIAIAAPRGHAKSTAGTIAYTLSMMLFRNSRYAMIVSDTEAQAIMFVSAIKQELQENLDIASFFLLRQDDRGVKFAKDTEADVIVEFKDGHQCRLVAKGAEQSLRGNLWNGTRPDLVVIDDLENDELVMNKDRREKLERWFNAALMPSLSRSGKVRYWGTILHINSLLESFMPSYTDKATVEEGLKMFSLRKTAWKGIKYKAHNQSMTEFLWPERFDKSFFEERREEAKRRGLLDLYSQEYLNYPIDEGSAYYRKQDFLERTPEDKNKNLRIYITADLAISQDERADYTAFLIAGVDEDRRIHILDCIKERLDGKEIVDTIFLLNNIYNPEAIGIEKMQVSQAIGPFLREEMIARDRFPPIREMSHMNKDKPTRGKSMQARLRARTVKFDKQGDWYASVEEELTQFPRSKNDDIADAFAYLGLLLDVMLEAPTNQELQDEEYELDYQTYTPSGRSKISGY
jgi:predicted phage terminase large subunit-like protein